MQAHPLALSELVARLRWFVALRWIAVAGIAGATIALRWPGGVALPVVPLLLIAAAIAALNLLHWLQLRQTDAAPITAPVASRRANLQIALDLFFLTLLLHFVGGVENPFYAYYVFHIIIASILLPALATYLQATLALLLFGGLAALELSGLIPHVAVAALGIGGAYRHAGYVLAVFAAFGSTLYLAAYFATTIVGRLREREREVLALRDSLLAEQERLRQAYGRLQETEAAKSRHMRRVGHQLRAPLGAVQTLLATVLAGLAGPVEGEARELLERAVARGREMLGLVDDLLALARAQEVRPALHARPVSLEETVRRVAGLLAAEAAAKGIALEATVPGGLPPLLGDPAGIEDLLANLVSNAIRYTPAGGAVRVSVAPGDGRLVITVSDTGIGIALDELPHIFEEFYRSERARALAREGSGLGLAIVRAVVKAHGGEVAVESTPGQGTAFTVSLPLAARSEDTASDLASGPSTQAPDRQDGQPESRDFGMLAQCAGPMLQRLMEVET